MGRQLGISPAYVVNSDWKTSEVFGLASIEEIAVVPGSAGGAGGTGKSPIMLIIWDVEEDVTKLVRRRSSTFPGIPWLDVAVKMVSRFGRNESLSSVSPNDSTVDRRCSVCCVGSGTDRGAAPARRFSAMGIRNRTSARISTEAYLRLSRGR